MSEEILIPAVPSKIRLALADDHALMRRGIHQILTKYGFNVIIEANNGKELMQQLEVAEALPHICILDINMPEMNGYATLEAIKKTYPDIKVLALSMYDNDFTVIKMLKGGANGYLPKDAEPRELERAVIAVYEDGFYHSELISSHVYNAIKQKRTPSYPKITDKELQFLELCCTDMTYREMADRMFLSPRTVERYGEIMYEKLNVKSRAGLVMFAMKMGLINNV